MPRRKKEAKREGKKEAEVAAGRYAYEGLDRLLHERARLGILTSLTCHPEGLLFGELKELCKLSDGNLSRHLVQLHAAGLVEVWKGFKRKRPQTLCRLTLLGRRRFVHYLSELERVVRDALPGSGKAEKKVEKKPVPAGSGSAVGWAPVTQG